MKQSDFVHYITVKPCFLLFTRTSLDPESDQPSSELLEAVNLLLNIKRNLAASWYKKMAAIEIDGDLKPMKVGGRGRVNSTPFGSENIYLRAKTGAVSSANLQICTWIL